MKRKIITLLLTISALFVFGSTVMAAEGNKANGFYDLGSGENVKMTVFSGDTEVSATEKNVDGDEELEQWYKDSNKIGVTYTEAIDGAYYSIVLVDGRGLPTKDSKIFYLNQATAEGTDVEFKAGIEAPESTVDMSLYISSNAEGFKLVNIPVSYAVGVEYHTPGDVDGNGKIEVLDITLTRRFITGGWGVVINAKAADVDADSAYTARDVILMRRFVAGGYNVELK